MQVVAKTPRIEVRITGEISAGLLRALEKECGRALEIITDPDEEYVDAVETDWYRDTKAGLTPGETLRIYRENAGLTQAGLGMLLGNVPRQHISGMEHGRRAISMGMAKRLAAALGVSPARLLGLDR